MTKSTKNVLKLIDVVGSTEKYNRYKDVLKNSLPKSAGNFYGYWVVYQRIANECLANPKVSNKASVLNCMYNAVKLGFNPDPVFGYIYFVPYKGDLTYQIGYKGMIELSIRSGKVWDVKPYRVFDVDIKNGNFDFYVDESGQHFKFKPSFPYGDDKGVERLVVSVFFRTGGSAIAHPVESEHIDAIKKVVLARTPSSPWGVPLYEPQMRLKTAIRQHWKTEPKSVEIARMIEYEESVERGIVPEQKHEELDDIIDEAPVESVGEEDQITQVFGPASVDVKR